MKTYGYKWIDFLSGNNTIKVTNENEFNKFKDFLNYLGITDILNTTNTFDEFQKLARINNLDENLFLFEYVNHKGLTWSDNIKESIKWYDKDPIDVSELEIFDIKTEEKSTKKDSDIDYDYE